MMCLGNLKRTKHKPETEIVCYKVVKRGIFGGLKTPIANQRVKPGIWIKAKSKTPRQIEPHNYRSEHVGLIAVYKRLKDIKKHTHYEVWRCLVRGIKFTGIQPVTSFGVRTDTMDAYLVTEIKLLKKVHD